MKDNFIGKVFIIILIFILVVAMGLGAGILVRKFSGSTKERTKVSREKEDEPEEEEDNGLSESEKRIAIDKLLNNINDFRYAIMFDDKYNHYLKTVGGYYDFKFDTYERTKAACMSKDVLKDQVISLSDHQSGQYVDENSLEELCMNMFGKLADVSQLKGMDEYFFEAVNDGGKPLLVWSEYESELDDMVIKKDITVSESECKADLDIYHGYWGYSSHNKPNYSVTIYFEENPDSEYGLVISKMRIKKTDDEYSWDSEQQESGNAYAVEEQYANAPFYGIWCFASKKYDDAQKECDKLVNDGFEAEVFLTSEWENLNSEPYYAVSAGRFATKEEAQYALNNVKAAGHKSAYIKYSGEFR